MGKKNSFDWKKMNMKTIITINEKTKLISIYEFEILDHFENFEPAPFANYIFKDPKYKISKDNFVYIKGYKSVYKIFLERCYKYTPENTPFETPPKAKKRWFSKKPKYYYSTMSVVEYKEKVYTTCTFKGFSIKIIHSI